MDKHELFYHFKEWRENDENEKIVAAVLALPEKELNDEILNWLAEAYIDIGEYKKAIAVLESQRPRMDDDFRWHFRTALALYHASHDEECDEDEDLRRNILERAKVALARGMNMNPPENMLETADAYMERIEDELDELNGINDDEDCADEPEMYEDEELDAIEEHIKEYYGDFPTVFHELASPDIHCDICIVPPSKERNYYTLLTMGMGAHIMDIPEELDASEYGRAELLMCLPPDWKVGENAEEWFWPISLLKNLARLPINSETWLGWGHSVDNRLPYADNTGFCGSLLIYPENVEDGAEVCVLPGGDNVNFFEVIPLYREEMNFKIDNDTKTLLEKMRSVGHVLDINRPNCCKDYNSSKSPLIDLASDHSKKITEKKLPIDPVNGCNHIAVFLRWCIEHDLVAPEFHEFRQDVIDGVLDGTQTDLRYFILDYFDGALEMAQLSFLGAGFAHYYYNWGVEDPVYFFPSDVDDYAEHYFGTEKYNSEEFQDEAYMFVPFNEEYYKGLSKYIDRAYADFYPGFAEYQYKCSVKTLEDAEKILKLNGVVPRFPEDIPKALKAAAENSEDKKNPPALMIIDNGGAIEDGEELRYILEDALNPFLETIAIAGVSSRELLNIAENRLGDAEPMAMPNDQLLGLEKRVKERFGAIPAVLTFDEEKLSLFIRTDDGKYIRYSGKAAKK